MEAQIGLYIAIGGLALTVIGTAVKLTWNARSLDKEIREDLREYMDAQIDNLQRDIKSTERGSLERADTLRHETGEMGAALRTKIHDVEMFTRDTFVRKDSFELVIGRIEKSIEKMTDKLEDKIDKAVERFQRPQ